MSELEVVTAAAGGFIALVAVLAFIAVQTGTVEGSVSLRINPLRKRKPDPAEDLARGDAP